ncbi:hypothetical protein [Anaerotruncus colihominis]|uniref:hypothetical protein n=1 Tax=Anaerotruncus colihominis TaxID=169435 RepID=UPI0026F144CF|nr:hypothetical protein [Anaerotruncus colihominis]
MTKEQAIAEFFQHNQIDPAQIARYLDPKLERLSEKVDQWLAIVEPSDRGGIFAPVEPIYLSDQ